MPYEIREDGPADKPYGVYREGSNNSLGHHVSRLLAAKHKTAILISEHASGTKSLEGDQELRLGLLITSNAYKDKQGEIVRQKALEDWVSSAWDGETYIAKNPLLFWHDSDPVGDIIYSGMRGPFLIEVARERPDTMVNLMPPGSPPVMASTKSIWDAVGQAPESWGTSHEFLFRKEDSEDKEYEQIVKTETSFLPNNWAANAYTLFVVL